MRSLLFAGLTLVAAAPAIAGGGSIPGQYVDVSPVALPVAENGQMRNYVFVTMRLNLRAGGDTTSVREKEPYFRDALVRAAHRRPFSVAGDMTRVDEAAIRAFVYRTAASILGPGMVTSVDFAAPPAPQRRTGVNVPHH